MNQKFVEFHPPRCPIMWMSCGSVVAIQHLDALHQAAAPSPQTNPTLSHGNCTNHTSNLLLDFEMDSLLGSSSHQLTGMFWSFAVIFERHHKRK